jgi:hypothetical protein
MTTEKGVPADLLRYPFLHISFSPLSFASFSSHPSLFLLNFLLVSSLLFHLTYFLPSLLHSVFHLDTLAPLKLSELHPNIFITKAQQFADGLKALHSQKPFDIVEFHEYAGPALEAVRLLGTQYSYLPPSVKVVLRVHGSLQLIDTAEAGMEVSAIMNKGSRQGKSLLFFYFSCLVYFFFFSFSFSFALFFFIIFANFCFVYSHYDNNSHVLDGIHGNAVCRSPTLSK